MNGFITKLISTDSIVSRLIRAILLAVVGGATGGGTVPGVDLHLPAWAISVLGLIVGMIPAGQNNGPADNVSKHS